MLDDAGLLNKYWAFAVSVLVNFKIRTATRSVVGKTPYKARRGSGRKPSWKHLCVFRCLAFVHVPKEKQPTELQKDEPLEDDSPPDPPNPKKMSRELSSLETSLGEAWKPPAEGSRRNRAGKLAESAQMALEDEELEDMNPFYAAAAISYDHEDNIENPKSYNAAAMSPLGDKWDTAMKDQ
jgi:hypothetical protein